MTFKVKNKPLTQKSRVVGFKTFQELKKFEEREGLKNASYGYSEKNKHFLEVDSKQLKEKPKQETLTIYDIKSRTSETSPYFFSKDTMRFFGQKMSDFTVTKRKDGKYDVSAPSYQDGKYMGMSKRVFNPKTNDLEFEDK